MIGIAVCTGETTADFEFAFRAIRKAVRSVFGITFQPTTLMSDTAPALRNAFHAVFGNTGSVVLMCWAHMRKNVYKKVSIVGDKKRIGYPHGHRQNARDLRPREVRACDAIILCEVAE